MIERLRRHPFLLAYWLTAANRLRNTRQRPWPWLAAGGLIAVTLSMLLVRYAIAPTPSAAVAQHALWMGVIAALHATAVVMNSRRLARSELAQSWLAATPRAVATLPFAVMVRTLWLLTWQLLLGVLLIFCGLAAGVVDLALTRRLLLLILAGACLGAAVGWYLGRTRRVAVPTQLQSVVVPQAVRALPIGASLRALSRWPIMQVMAWANPKALRWPFIVASLTVPLGFSAVGGLFVISTWALLLYMIGLLAGVARVAQDAGHWLRATPLPLWSFTHGLLSLALPQQLAASAVMAGVLLFAIGGEGIGGFTLWTLYLWTAIVLTTVSMAVAAGRALRDVRPWLVVGLAAVLTGAAFAPVLALPAALSCSVWCWWRGLRA
jgi:hypothetical protein